MKNKIYVGVCVALCVTICSLKLIPAQKGLAGARNVKVLLLMTNLNYGPNSYFYRDAMAEFGFDITIAGVTRSLAGCNGNPTINADVLVSEIHNIADYDVLAIGPGSWRNCDVYRDILNDTLAIRLVKSAADSGLVLWAVCGGVRVLAAADVLRGRNVIGARNFRSEYEAAGATFLGDDHPPVIDSNVVTGVSGQSYYLQNIEAMLTALDNLRRAGGTKGEQK